MQAGFEGCTNMQEYKVSEVFLNPEFSVGGQIELTESLTNANDSD